MALSGPDTGGSQFFINHAPTPHLDANYTVFGQVIAGMELVDSLVMGSVIEHITVTLGEPASDHDPTLDPSP